VCAWRAARPLCACLKGASRLPSRTSRKIKAALAAEVAKLQPRFGNRLCSRIFETLAFTRSCMRPFIHFAIVVIMSTLTIAQSLPTPQAVTDPKQIASKPNAQVEKNLSIEKLYMTRQVGASDWSPDGKQIVFVSNISGRNNLWLVPAEGGWPLQLTVSDQRQTSPAWSPDGKWIAYQSDYDGDEQWDLFIVSPKTGQVANLANTREIAEMSPTWSPDGRYLACMVKPKTSSVFEIDIFDMVMRK